MSSNSSGCGHSIVYIWAGWQYKQGRDIYLAWSTIYPHNDFLKAYQYTRMTSPIIESTKHESLKRLYNIKYIHLTWSLTTSGLGAFVFDPDINRGGLPHPRPHQALMIAVYCTCSTTRSLDPSPYDLLHFLPSLHLHAEMPVWCDRLSQLTTGLSSPRSGASRILRRGYFSPIETSQGQKLPNK
jgi:hypothetical protein